MAGRVLLDTCAIVFLTEGLVRGPEIRRVLEAARPGDLVVSAVSAWEIGTLSRLGPPRRVRFEPSAADWFQMFVDRFEATVLPLGARAALDAAMLPDPPHGDPADRLLIATARELEAPIVTRDRRILEYAAAGHVQAIAC